MSLRGNIPSGVLRTQKLESPWRLTVHNCGSKRWNCEDVWVLGDREGAAAHSRWWHNVSGIISWDSWKCEWPFLPSWEKKKKKRMGRRRKSYLIGKICCPVYLFFFFLQFSLPTPMWAAFLKNARIVIKVSSATLCVAFSSHARLVSLCGRRNYGPLGWEARAIWGLAWSKSKYYSHVYFAFCQGFPPNILRFRTIRLHFLLKSFF